MDETVYTPCLGLLIIALVGFAPASGAELSKLYDDNLMCGPISLSLAATHVGLDVNVQSIVDRVTITKEGTGLDQLRNAARELDLEAEAYELESTNDLTNLRTDTPAIIQLHGNHFATVFVNETGELWLADYPDPIALVDLNKLTEIWDPRILVIKNRDTPAAFSDDHRRPSTLFFIGSAAFALTALLFYILRPAASRLQ